MIGTYAAVLAVCGASLAIGQAALALCGTRRWSWLAPAVGLALLCAVCWATVRLPGDGPVSAIVVAVLVGASAVYLRGRLEGGREALLIGLPVALGALLATSLPFAVEGHFGILGTSFNPDMSQHLLATARLTEGEGSQLLGQGYPLGPHAIVVALNKGLGIGLVQGFSGLTVAVAVLACLTPLAAFAEARPLPRTVAALVVGLAYVVASYFAQGAFKETMQALFVLAFVLALRESGRAERRDLSLRFVPAALIAVGSVYAYSFAGLVWLFPVLAIWLLLERGAPLRSPRSLLLGLLAFAVLIAPEVGRMLDFQRFETFDPNGPGLGNLFGQVSPMEALGIWPSGDFRLAPGDGAVPAIGYYLGAAFGLVLLAYGAVACWKRRETAILAGLLAVAVAYLAARLGGTPYTAAKAIEVAAPICALTILLPLIDPAGRHTVAMRQELAQPARRWAAALFMLAAGACSLLALANAPVGPTSFTPALAEIRKQVGPGPTLVLASPALLTEQHGTPFLAWELRGGRVCIKAASEAGETPTTGVRFVVAAGEEAPYSGLRLRRAGPAYSLWETRRPPRGESPCPLIAVRQARQGPAR
ncbi:MAG TPA: hypothetical protein VK889_00700 [Solirubrobacterales bacterium]|nr:hypothetical protein [Solirubrobacterales bacterium]